MSKTINPAKKKRAIALHDIKHGQNVREDKDGTPVCDTVLIKAGAIIPFDPSSEGLIEGVHYTMAP